MRQQRPKDCFHKILTFQVHKGCQQNAAICQNKCQNIHSTNFPPCTIPMKVIQDHFNQIKHRLIEVMKLYTSKFSKEYEEVMKDFQKKYTENLREMEKQMLAVLIKAININKDVLDKIQNERLEKLKCNQIFNYLEEKADFQEKLKSAPLQPIYEKNLNSLRLHHKNFNWSAKSQQNQQNLKSTSANATNNINGSSDLIQVQDQSQKTIIQKYQNQIKILNQDKEGLQHELRKLRHLKRQNLKQNTWDILKVKTKKIMKNAKENKVNEAINPPKQLIQEQKANVAPQNKENAKKSDNSDSDDILDYIEKNKNKS